MAITTNAITNSFKEEILEGVHDFTPTSGDCFIFPALLTHLVLPFRCEGIRISVSGNLTYNNRHEWPDHFF